MAGRPPHIDWLHNTGEQLATADGQIVEVWDLRHGKDGNVLSAWAAHFRNHYCSDADLPAMVEGMGLSPAQYLISIIFPDAKDAPGPSVRSGDFAEILVADFVEYILEYWCPREFRYRDRWNKNDSTKGCDVIGFKFASETGQHPDDELLIFEAKAALSATNKNRLQDAVDDSIKDTLREAMTLNAIKQRFHDRGELTLFLKVQRFQNMADQPFRRANGAAAVLDDDVFDTASIITTNASAHPNTANLKLLVVRGPALMDLV